MYDHLPIHIQLGSFKGEGLTDRKKERLQTVGSSKRNSSQQIEKLPLAYIFDAFNICLGKCLFNKLR